MSLVRNSARTAAALAVGALGGWVFFRIGAPLPWMLGALAATLVVTVAGMPLPVDPRLRNGALPVMGVLVGASFEPGILAEMANWPAGIALVGAFVLAASWVGYLYLRHVAGWDAPTSVYAVPPGGMAQLLLVGAASGADERRILLIHSIRIAIAVAASSLLVRFALGYDISAAATGAPAARGAELSLADGAVLLACAVAGEVFGRLARMPGGGMLGALILSAVVHVTGLTHVAPPGWIIIAAQVLLGAGLGGRFVGLTRAELGRVVVHSVLWGVFLVVAAFALALAAAPVLHLPVGGLFLALAPGGFSEMMLVALAIGIEPAFVATCHTLRIAFIVAVMPLLGGLVLRNRSST